MSFTKRLNQFLVEAGRKHRYMEMFKPLLPEEGNTKKPERKNNIERRIAWATNNLKREDRVIWYLRKFRDYMKARDLGAGPHADDIPEVKEWQEINDLEEDFQHYISNAEVNDLTSVLKYVFPPNESATTIIKELKKLETHDLEKSTERTLDPDPEQKPLIKFADGWTWYLIDAETCEKEGKAMKHCGNTGEFKKFLQKVKRSGG